MKDLYYVERFVLRWVICITLNDLYYVEWFVQHWIIFYFVAKFLPPWMTCTAKELYIVERFVLRWMSRSAMDDLYNVESFGLPLIIDYRLFNECQVCLFKKILSDILHEPLGWLFPDLEISRIFGPAPQIGQIEMFLITLVETIINVFSRHI